MSNANSMNENSLGLTLPSLDYVSLTAIDETIVFNLDVTLSRFSPLGDEMDVENITKDNNILNTTFSSIDAATQPLRYSQVLKWISPPKKKKIKRLRKTAVNSSTAKWLPIN